MEVRRKLKDGGQGLEGGTPRYPVTDGHTEDRHPAASFLYDQRSIATSRVQAHFKSQETAWVPDGTGELRIP